MMQYIHEYNYYKHQKLKVILNFTQRTISNPKDDKSKSFFNKFTDSGIFFKKNFKKYIIIEIKNPI
jgi:hypothetical protein